MRFIRQCAREGELDASNPRQDWSCYDQLGTYRVKVKYCHCKVDGCNTGSVTNLPSNKLMLAIAALLTLGRYIDYRQLLPA